MQHQPDSPAHKRRLVNTRGLSEYLNGVVSEGTLRNQRIKGTGFPFLKLENDAVAYDLDVVDTILEARRRTSTSQSSQEAA